MWQVFGFVGTIAIQAIGIAFFAGVFKRTLDDHTDDIKGLKSDAKVHDREIGDLYAHSGVQREIGRATCR